MDAGKRASDHINNILVGQGFSNVAHKTIAINLGTGDYDGTLYDTKRDAVRHQKNEFLCMYLQFRSMRGGVTPEEMARVIQVHRQAYANGFRLPDPDDKYGGPELLIDTPTNDVFRMMMRDIENLLRAERQKHGY